MYLVLGNFFFVYFRRRWKQVSRGRGTQIEARKRSRLGSGRRSAEIDGLTLHIVREYEMLVLRRDARCPSETRHLHRYTSSLGHWNYLFVVCIRFNFPYPCENLHERISLNDLQPFFQSKFPLRVPLGCHDCVLFNARHPRLSSCSSSQASA